MAKIYYRKIINNEFNPATGEPWKLEDVPVRWRDAVEVMLNDRNRQP